MSKQNIIFFLGGAAAGGLITWIIEEARLRDLNTAWELEYAELLEESYASEENEETPEDEKEDDKEQDARMDKRYHRKVDAYRSYHRSYRRADDVLAENEHPLDDGEEPTDEITMTPEELVEAVTDPNYKDGKEMYERKERARIKGPTLITNKSFNEDFPEFDKDELYYYTLNDVLATEDDEVVDNELYVVGDCLDKFDFRHNAEDIIYIRNAGMSTDYTIHKVRGAFSPPEEDGIWG